MAVDATLQNNLADCGMVWVLIPLLFRYDKTMEGGQRSSTAPADTPEQAVDNVEVNMQVAANLQCKLAARALARLCGWLEGDLDTPRNERLQEYTKFLFTPVLARRLCRATPDGLLAVLNGHEESPTVMWNADMRAELLEFVSARLDAVRNTGRGDAGAALRFRFKTLHDELVLADIYVRLYCKAPNTPLDDPFGLAVALLGYVDGVKSPHARE